MTSLPVPPNYANHVLVASPSTVVRERVLESLRSPARCFEQAAGGAEALVHLESGFWQVLFLDRQLPDLDAEELSHTVRRRFPEIEVVLLDGDAGAVADREKDMLAEAWPALRQAESREWSGQRDDERANSECGDHASVRKAVSDSFSNCAAPLPGMVGNSLVMQPVYRLARLLA
ncbi:MAG: hypothetical protein WCF48_01335, partial [Terriglobales bacterium]